ncbi:MAG TPA: STAS domain-containing protein [Solirubrobacterales bacterium]|nr:STAS domain-containing protein [Solirubrobacterales bacterium]
MPQFDSLAQSQDRVRPFRLTEQRIWPGCIEIEIEGELDLAVSDRLRAALDAAQAGPCHVLVGFGACSFIDLSGLAILAAARQALAGRDRQLLLHGVHGQVRRMLSMTGLAEKGLLVSSGAAGALPPNGDPGPGQSFEVTVAGGESVRLTLPGIAAA